MTITNSINKIALFIAAVSFLLGTLLLIWYMITGYSPLIEVGMLYILVAFVLNGITLIGLVGNAIVNRHLFQENITAILLVLLNIPISLGYFYLVLHIHF